MTTKSRRPRAEAPKKSPTLKFLEDTAGRPLTLGGLLESIRLGKAMSQAAFAKKLGISSSHLCDIEKDRKVVGPERAARFAAILAGDGNTPVAASLVIADLGGAGAPRRGES